MNSNLHPVNVNSIPKRYSKGSTIPILQDFLESKEIAVEWDWQKDTSTTKIRAFRNALAMTIRRKNLQIVLVTRENRLWLIRKDNI